MNRPGDPRLMWLYQRKRTERYEGMDLLLQCALKIVRRADGDGHRKLSRLEMKQVDDLIGRAVRIRKELQA